jgi:S-adenosylmethionine uptake transporter
VTSVPATAGARAAPRATTGALLVLAGILILPGMDAIAKALTGVATVSTIAFVRYVTQIVLSAPSAWRRTNGRPWPPPRPALIVLRGLLFAAGGLLFFAGVQRLALADNLAITLVYPFVVAALAPLVLGERLARRAIVAVLAGFVGALVIIRPGTGAFGAAALLPLGFAACYAGYVLTTRALAREHIAPSVIQLWTAISSGAWVSLAFVAAAAIDVPALAFHVGGWRALLAMCAMGVVGTTGHWLVTTGARHVPASVQAGLGYAEIVSTALLGWLVWGDVPDAPTWLGVAIVVTSGLWLVRLHVEREPIAEEH